MKTSLAALAVVSTLGFTTSAQAYSVNCVRAAYYDSDGDGYAMEGTPTPLGWPWRCLGDRPAAQPGVRRGGDCNDWNPNVHPRNLEVSQNNIDDN